MHCFMIIIIIVVNPLLASTLMLLGEELKQLEHSAGYSIDGIIIDTLETIKDRCIPLGDRCPIVLDVLANPISISIFILQFCGV